MNKPRKIKFTGKNLEKFFMLPCVKSIFKFRGKPHLELYAEMVDGVDRVVPPDCNIIEHSNGQWEICYKEFYEKQEKVAKK